MKHFTANDFNTEGKKISLKKFAVPTIFEPNVVSASIEKDYENIEFLVENNDDIRDNAVETCNNNFIEPCNQCYYFEEQIKDLTTRCNELKNEMERNNTMLNTNSGCRNYKAET